MQIISTEMREMRQKYHCLCSQLNYVDERTTTFDTYCMLLKLLENNMRQLHTIQNIHDQLKIIEVYER